MDKPLREQFPRREQSPEELEIIRQQKDVENRDKQNAKIRCPCCKKNKYFNQYFGNKDLGTLVCPNCGVLFLDQAKLKIIKKNITQAKQRGLTKNV